MSEARKYYVSNLLEASKGYYLATNVSKLRKDGFEEIGKNNNISSPQRRKNAAPVDEPEL